MHAHTHTHSRLGLDVFGPVSDVCKCDVSVAMCYCVDCTFSNLCHVFVQCVVC